ncbi:MAG: hypothetical protein KatS3mg081_2210 [Gemmatimonadales bacterium]|nr:hypothetical protein HRbin33_01035 [bacterium HR33]GIW52855.1 MAG: hypothetical protein KatS3mg081_2210 [Gemmatimonadales bacterium]
MVAHPRAPLRVDRLRALNLPQPVEVRTDTEGLPAAVRFPIPRSPHPAGHNIPDSPALAATTAGNIRPRTGPIRRDGTARTKTAGLEITTPNYEEWKPLEAIIEIWRVDDEWWRKPVARLYVEAVLEGGKRTLLYRDLATGQWFAQQP